MESRLRPAAIKSQFEYLLCRFPYMLMKDLARRLNTTTDIVAYHLRLKFNLEPDALKMVNEDGCPISYGILVSRLPKDDQVAFLNKHSGRSFDDFRVVLKDELLAFRQATKKGRVAV